MLSQSVDRRSDWAGDSRDLIVVCADLHDSMAHRLSRESRARSEMFLKHNRILYDCVREWERREVGSQAGVELVDFVGDAGLITFLDGFYEDALAFSCELVDRVRSYNLETAIGIDVGEVSVLELYDADEGPVGMRHAVGYAVDRAVRLSWIAGPGQIFATNAVSSSIDGTHFDVLPTADAVGVSLDKWPETQNVWGGVKVHVVERRDPGRTRPPARPANIPRLVDYFRQLQLETHEFLREAPKRWRGVMNQFRSTEQWHIKLALDEILDVLESSRRLDNSRIPELDGFREGARDCLEDFVSWREGMLTKIQDMQRNYNDVTRAALKNLQFEETLQRVAGNVILFCIASLKRLSA